MKKLLHVLLSILLVTIMIPTTALTAEPISIDSLGTYIESEFEKTHIPGMSVQVVDAKHMLVSEAYGDCESINKPFIIGSMSKSFTAVAIMQLVEQGKINLSKPFTDYLPASDGDCKTTVKQLLNHTSGISIYSTVENYKATDTIAPYEYANANYGLLGKIVAHISGMDYGAYIQKNIFDPLDMKNSYTSLEAAKANGLVDGYRNYFGMMTKGEMPYPKGEISGWLTLPAGYIISTAEDTGKYLQSHLLIDSIFLLVLLISLLPMFRLKKWCSKQNRTISLSHKTTEELTEAVEVSEINCALVLHSPTEYTYIVDKIGLHDANQAVIEQIMLQNYQLNSMVSLGISEENASSLISASIDGNVIQNAKDRNQTFFYTYILVFALYLSILMHGQQVATAIATEKSSRAMEMLITSAKPQSLLFGKIIGSGLAGLLQLSAILASGAVFWLLNKDLWGDNQIANSIFVIPPYLVFYMVLFFVLGFFIYAFLFGAVGSLASRVEDINTTTMPIIMVFVGAFMLVMVSMMSGNVDSTAMVVASYVPVTSPMAMFVRISMSEVAPIVIFVSVAILIASTVSIGYLAAKIYRAGVLMYGKPPKLLSLLKGVTK